MKARSAVHDFPVVCAGGSTGGFDAYIRLLRHLPTDMGVAIVIVNHLMTVANLLHEILPRHTCYLRATIAMRRPELGKHGLSVSLELKLPGNQEGRKEFGRRTT